jgi:hypothetical protein
MNNYDEQGKNISFRPPRKALALGIGVALAFLLFILSFQVFENLDASQIMVIQSPVKGKLNWYTTPGVKIQWFGKVTKLMKRSQFWFSSQTDQGKKLDESIKIRFNDGGHAQISGSIAWEIPLDEANLTSLYVKYGSQHAIEQQLVRTVIEKAVYMAGPLMSSTESYSEKRNDLLSLIEDQVQRGVYKTQTFQEQKPDPMTGIMKTVNVVKLVIDKEKNIPIRAETSPLQDFGIRTFNLSINEVKYDKDVEAQIQQQQKAIMQVQIAVAQAKEAEQKAITVGKEGEAKAATAKWEQEVIKAKEVTAAEQRKRVAELDAQAAEQTKRQQTLLGEGEAARRRLVMEADNALQAKLDAYIRVEQIRWENIAKYTGSWVPQTVFGGSSQAGSGAQAMIDLLTAKTAKDLNLDMSIKTRVKDRTEQQK